MKKGIVIGAVVLVVLGGIVWFVKSRETGNVQGLQTTTASFTFATIQQDVDGGAKLYDVRTADEYASGHFPGATNWPLQDMQAGTVPDVAKDTKLYVYCRSGNRSGQAATILKNTGYTNVNDLHGLSNVESLGGTLVTK